MVWVMGEDDEEVMRTVYLIQEEESAPQRQICRQLLFLADTKHPEHMVDSRY